MGALPPFSAAASVKRWTVPTGHQRPPPPLKRWTKLLPAYGAHVRYPLDEHERSELPWARIAWGATPAHVRYPLDEHERSELP